MSKPTKFAGWQRDVLVALEAHGTACTVGEIPPRQWRQWYVQGHALDAVVALAEAHVHNTKRAGELRRKRTSTNRYGNRST